MRIFLILLAFLSISSQALAASGHKPWRLGWWPSHWQNQDFKPYLDDPKIPQNSQWQDDSWVASDWDSRGGPARTMDGLYHAGIITGQSREGGIPVLEVGHNFMRLSTQDKRRVAAYVDHVYGITALRPDGMFYVYYDCTDEPVGVYTAAGLQLQ